MNLYLLKSISDNNNTYDEYKKLIIYIEKALKSLNKSSGGGKFTKKKPFIDILKLINTYLLNKK